MLLPFVLSLPCDATDKVSQRFQKESLALVTHFTLWSLSHQLWRAIRLIVDTGLHSLPNFTRDDALWYFDEYAWDNTDLAKKEVLFILNTYMCVNNHSDIVGRLLRTFIGTQ